MPAVKGPWSRSELASFLEAALVPIRLGCHHTNGGLWMLSLWYEYDDDTIRCATSEKSDIARFLREDPSVCFEISTNRPPYMGVRGAGTATLTADGGKAQLRSLLERYLGGTESELASMLLAEDREELLITVEPDRLYTWDFTDRMESILVDCPAADAPEPDSPKYS